LVLVDLEVFGPEEVAGNFQAQYKAIAHYDNGDTADVTDLADWSVDDETIASITDGLLLTEPIGSPKDVTIRAEYTKGQNTEVAEKQVSIFAICPSGSALDFDGINDYVKVNNSASLDMGDTFTVALWVNYEGGSTPRNYERMLTRKAAWNSFNGWEISLETNYDTDITVRGSSGAGYPPNGADDVVSSWAAGGWHHIVVVYEGATATVYSDGVQRDTVTIAAVRNNNLPLYIGRYGEFNIHHWNGLIDEVRIYDRALSVEEIRASMHIKLTGDEDRLVAYWDFDEGEGQILGDLSGNGNDGILAGPKWVESDAPIGICIPVSVAVDIKPGSCPNPLNLKSQGVLPVAILGTQDFDAGAIDAVSVELAGVGAIRHSYEDVASPVTDGNECECTEDGPDGYIDLALKFRTQDIVEQLIYSQDDLAKDQTLALTLTGELFDDTGIEGTDCVVLVGNVPKWLAARRLDYNEDGIVNIRDFAAMAEYWLEATDY